MFFVFLFCFVFVFFVVVFFCFFFFVFVFLYCRTKRKKTIYLFYCCFSNDVANTESYLLVEPNNEKRSIVVPRLGVL